MDICRVEEPELIRISEARTSRCWLYTEHAHDPKEADRVAAAAGVGGPGVTSSPTVTGA
jgi:hypothetical protein